jgi:poly-gamma-glutamate capsule biosynthesis protein CapA/YwtB (metallophosphatase superfamily)
MMGTDLRKGASGLAEGSGEDLFVGVDALLQQADVAFLNHEGTLSDSLPQTKCSPKSTACYAFRTPLRYTQALVDAGIDVVSLANNHAMDLGVPGMDSSIAALDAAGVAHAGRYGDIAWLEHEGQTIAVLAAHSGSCCLNVNRIDEVTAAIREADRKADVVVLSFHGGAEGYDHRHVPGEVEVAWGERRGDVRALAHAAVEAGADLVLGHGPHVLRGMEVYQGRLIAYSLGNFCGYNQFGTQGGYGGTSVIVEATLAHNGVLVSAKLHPVALDSLGRPRPDPSGAAWTQIGELSAADFPETAVRVGEDGSLSW